MIGKLRSLLFAIVLSASMLSSLSYASSIETCASRLLIDADSELVVIEVMDYIRQESVVIDDEFVKYLLVLMYVESTFRADAVSPANAIGLLQLTRIAVKDVGAEFSVDKLKDPYYNVYVGSRFLELLKSRHRSWVEILIAYNGGSKWIDRFHRGKPIPQETERFVMRVQHIKETRCD